MLHENAPTQQQLKSQKEDYDKKTKIRSELSSEAGLAKGRVQSAYKEMLAQYAALISDTHPTIVAGVQDMSNVSDLSHLSDSEEASQEQMIDVIKQVSYRTQQAAEAPVSYTHLSMLIQHFVPQAPQSCTYRRTEYIQSAIPPALKCLRNGEENEQKSSSGNVRGRGFFGCGISVKTTGL